MIKPLPFGIRTSPASTRRGVVHPLPAAGMFVERPEMEQVRSFWRKRLATPPCPFFGWSFADSRWGRRLHSWNASSANP